MLKVFTVLMLVMLIAGCGSGGGGGGGGLGSLFDSGGSSSGGGFDSGGGGTIPISHTPEPTTLALFGIGLAGLAVARLKKRKKI